MKTPFMLALILALPAPAMAQYLYLDSNGNGIHDGSDQLNPNGEPTVVDLYIHTDENRDGTKAVGNTEPGLLLTINSYVVNLLAVGGTVTYSDFVNHPATMGFNFGEINPDGASYKNGYGGATKLPPGPYHLCTLTITGETGTPQIDIVDMVDGSLDYTSFGTQVSGNAWDNTYKLDGPNTRDYQGTADFFDADGLDPWSGPLMTNPGHKTVTEETLLQFTVTATGPGQTLTYSLALGVPAATGASINPSTGIFTWTPTDAQGPGTYPVTVTVTDNGTTPSSDSEGFTITVIETNPASGGAPAADEGGQGCTGSSAFRAPAFLFCVLHSVFCILPRCRSSRSTASSSTTRTSTR